MKLHGSCLANIGAGPLNISNFVILRITFLNIDISKLALLKLATLKFDISKIANRVESGEIFKTVKLLFPNVICSQSCALCAWSIVLLQSLIVFSHFRIF